LAFASMARVTEGFMTLTRLAFDFTDPPPYG